MPGGSVGRGSDCAPRGAEERELGGRPDRHPLSRGMTRPGGHEDNLGSRLSALGSRLSALGSRLSALGSRLSADIFRCHRSLPGSRLRVRPNRRNTALYLRIFPNCPYSFPTGRHRTASHRRSCQFPVQRTASAGAWSDSISVLHCRVNRRIAPSAAAEPRLTHDTCPFRAATGPGARPPAPGSARPPTRPPAATHSAAGGRRRGRNGRS